MGIRGGVQEQTRQAQPRRLLAAGSPDACFVVFEVAARAAHEALEAGKCQRIVVKQLHKHSGQVGPVRGRTGGGGGGWGRTKPGEDGIAGS